MNTQVDEGRQTSRRLLFPVVVLLVVAFCAVSGPLSKKALTNSIDGEKRVAVEKARQDTDPRTSGHQFSADYATVKSLVENGTCKFMFTVDTRVTSLLNIRRVASCRVYQNYVELTTTNLDIVDPSMRYDIITRTIFQPGTGPSPYNGVNCKFHMEYKRLVTGANAYPPYSSMCTLAPNPFWQSHFKVGIALHQENWVTHVTKHVINGGATGQAVRTLMNDKGICPSMGLIRGGSEEVVFESEKNCGYYSAKPWVQGSFIAPNGDKTVVLLRFLHGDVSLSDCRVAVLTSTGATVVGATTVSINQHFPAASAVLNGATCSQNHFVLYW